MIDAGVFHPEARLQLIDGEIIEMSPQKSPHATAVNLAQNVLMAAFGPDYSVRVQLPLGLGDRSEPEPDVAVAAGSPRRYAGAHPTEAVLVVEVSDSTLAFDRGAKLRLYARHGLPEYWIVNLVDAVLEVYRDPAGDTYRAKQTHGRGERLAPGARPEAAVAVDDLLP